MVKLTFNCTLAIGHEYVLTKYNTIIIGRHFNQFNKTIYKNKICMISNLILNAILSNSRNSPVLANPHSCTTASSTLSYLF